MANNANEVVVGGSGTVYVAATAATAPSDSDSAPGAGWAELGFVSEDGATFSVSKELTDINAWQSLFPIRRIVTGATVSVAFVLRQWNENTLPFALGGGEVAAGSGSGEFVYTPPEPDEIDERSLILDWSDGDKDYRLYIPRGMVSEGVEANLTRTAAADLPITFSAVTDGTTDAFSMFTNDPAFTTGS